jgi:hypothetical protein
MRMRALQRAAVGRRAAAQTSTALWRYLSLTVAAASPLLTLRSVLAPESRIKSTQHAR